MGKTLILSQKQMNEVFGGNVDYFADETGFGNVANNEVFINPLSDKPTADPTTDVVAKEMGKASTYFGPGSSDHSNRVVSQMREGNYTKQEFDALLEINQELVNMNMTSVDANGNKIQGNESVLAKHKTQAKQRGDKKAYDAISRTLDAQRNAVKTRKKRNKEIFGMANQFHKAPKKLGGTTNTNNITYN